MKKILILANIDMGLYNFRKELLENLLAQGYEVHISLPEGPRVKDMVEMGCKFIETPVDRRGMNPIADLKLFFKYRKMLKKIKPDVVLTYTIKPNIYGGLACRMAKVPYLSNITGLGSAVENGGAVAKLLTWMYRRSTKYANCIFFQNEENKKYFEDHKLLRDNHRLIPGSGVNLQRFQPMDYPNTDTTEFVFISRLMKEKGIDQYLEAAKEIRKNYPETAFHVCGFCEKEYEDRMEALTGENIVEYHGVVKDVREILTKVHCIIHPTYYPEGMSNVLLESAASAKPMITTDRSGCREIVEDGKNGYIVRQQDASDLIEKIQRFLALSYEEKREMGLCARKKVEREFDRQIVVDAYLEEIQKCTGGKQ